MLWLLCYGSRAMTLVLNPRICGSCAMALVLRLLCYGSCAMALVLWLLGYGSCPMALVLNPPWGWNSGSCAVALDLALQLLSISGPPGRICSSLAVALVL